MSISHCQVLNVLNNLQIDKREEENDKKIEELTINTVYFYIQIEKKQNNNSLDDLKKLKED